MSISDKMADVLYNLIDKCQGNVEAFEDVYPATQAVINAAWFQFDIDDEKTWPEKSCVKYIIKTAHNTDICFWDKHQKWVGGTLGSVIRYALLKDLLYVREKS